MKRLLFLSLFTLLIHSAYSQQIREFSSDTAVFVDEFYEFMSGVNEDEEDIVDAFLIQWEYDSLDYEQKTGFIETANHMLRRRGKPSPHFINLIKIIDLYLKPQNEDKKIEVWLDSYRTLVGSPINFNEILRAQKIALNLLCDSVLYDLAGTKWKYFGQNYYFDESNDRPVIKLMGADLVCVSNRDTMEILNTKGVYNPISLKFKGEGGKVNWQKAGLDPDEVYAILTDYDLSLNRSFFNADSVLFYYKKYFNYSLEGRLQEKAVQISDPGQAQYPKFFSYKSRYEITDLFPSINFVGGLSMQGGKLVGTGSKEDLSKIRIFVSDTLRMSIESENIVIRENSMNCTEAAVKIYLENDSIYHPDLQFLYLEKGDEVRLTKGDTYNSGVPYVNTYHKLNMNFEELQWKRGSDYLHLKPSVGRAIGTASFESANFFNYSFYADLQGRDYTHPLVDLWRFSDELNGLREFPVSAFSGNIGKSEFQIRHQMMKLARLGFLYFNDETGMVRLNDKMFYFLKASMQQTDYDVISFKSEVIAPQDNATLNMKTFDLKVNGVPNIFLSDSQNVVLAPDKNQIIIKRNRNFQFDGSIRTGLLTLYGENFFFKYEEFKVNLQDIDSLRISVANEDKITGKKTTFDIDNLVQDLTGEILIDNPLNKSGLEDYPEYPIFKSKEKSYVYFDDPKIQAGVYKHNEVFFEIYPFELDSLDNFAREGMNLKGKFQSKGMIPPLEQTLILQADNSLGFKYSTSDKGLPVYNGKATFYADISMSSKGLHGSGQLDYLTSSTYSDDFTFHPDSLMTKSREFMMRKKNTGTQFPKVNSQNNEILWNINNEEFFVEMDEIPFTMFQDSINHTGDLMLTPSGLSGNGKLDMVSSAILSDDFTYKAERILSDTASFRLKSVSSEKFAISTENVMVDINLDNSHGKFYANDDFTIVDFPEIVYESKLDFFNWDMLNETVEMGQSKALGKLSSNFEDSLTGPRYISKMPSQDSLSFVSPLAIYDYRNARLDAKKVPYLIVADTRIYPHEGMITVGRNADMKQLKNAGLDINRFTEYYKCFNANVNVKGKYDYNAIADYNYVDLRGENQVIHFYHIAVDTSMHSYALAEISQKDSFLLSPYFAFKGVVKMFANEPYMVFDGGTRIQHNCDLGRHWLKFETSINPDSILIPVPQTPLNYDMAPTYIGTMITRDSTHVYSTFTSQRKGYFDNYISTANGFLRFNQLSERFEIADIQRLSEPDAPGDYLALDASACTVHSDGEMNLQLDFGQVKMTTYGISEQNKEADTYSAKMLMGFDFHFSDLALTEFAHDVDSIPGMDPSDPSDPFYKHALFQLVGRDAAERMEADLGLYAEYRTIPPEFNHKLLFSDVPLEWNQLSRTYRYHGDISVVKIGNEIVNKRVEAYIELTKRASGDLIDIYLQLPDDNYYYFGYNPGSLQVVSSNRNFNGIVFELKDKLRKLKVRAGNTGYIYSLGSERRVQMFLRRYRATEEQAEMEEEE